jgi:outer membrane protein TolC
VVSVAEEYFSVLRARRLVEAADRSLARATRLRTTSEARSRVGLATELDVLRADLLASQSEVALVAQREALESALDGLKTLIGRPMEDNVELADTELADVGTPSPEPAERFIDTALVKRLDVQEAHDRIGDARRTESVARWNLLPPVNVDLSYTKRGIGSGGPVAFGQLFNGWHVGVSTSYSLDRSDEAAAAAAAAVSSRAARRDSLDTERRVADEVRRAFRSWARTLTTCDLQSKAVALAERQLRLAEIRYDRGVAGNFDVIDAENNLFQAQSGLVGAQVERALAGLTLRRVTGALDPDTFQP